MNSHVTQEEMVQQQIVGRGVSDPALVAALRQIPRERFVPEESRAEAYEDHPLPIGYGQTISQPYLVALMTELARPQATDRALDVGTGSGYQAAVLSKLVSQVAAIEIVPELAERAEAVCQELGLDNIDVKAGDGLHGWPEKAPFDVIILAAAPEKFPDPLVDQLANGGRMVLPVGATNRQELLLVERDTNGRVSQQKVTDVRFVPMTGEAASR